MVNLSIVFVVAIVGIFSIKISHQQRESVDDILINGTTLQDSEPEFGEPVQNYTVAVGQEVFMTCIINNLQAYKVAWVRLDTYTILSIHTHMITRDPRITITQMRPSKWVLRIRDVKESDKGWYMCQVNTEPMRNQTSYLNVVGYFEDF